MALAMDMTAYPAIAGRTIKHLLNVQKDDGRWDMPLLTSPFSWDALGDAAGIILNHYLFVRDKQWLRQTYPHLISASRWIRYNREQTELPFDAPEASKPVKPYLSYPCMDVPKPPPEPGEKPYTWGLLPVGYGDSELPDDHACSRNVMPLYALACARQAAMELGQPRDAQWLTEEYSDYKQAILTAIQRAVKLEKEGPPDVPATQTYPEGAVSQTLLAVFPTHLFSPNSPLVTGLLARMERTARNGLPTNMGWLGRSGVWPGESMDVAETYLLRGETEKTVKLLIATLNYSYSTKVWREEILVDKTLPTACGKPHPANAQNRTGTGDMPEASAHANLIILVRNMLVREEGKTLHLLSGVPPDWINLGEKITVRDAPTLLGKVSYTLTYSSANKMALDLTLIPGGANVLVHFPLGRDRRITAARVNGQVVAALGRSVTLKLPKSTHMEIEFK